MPNLPMSTPHMLKCKNCRSITIVVLSPGLMMPTSQMDELKCPACRQDGTMKNI